MASIFRNVLASVTGLGLVLGLANAPALAQANDGGFNNHSGDADSNEVFSGSGVSITDIMGNIRNSDGLSSDEFSRKSDRNIDEAAADFQQRQREALEAQQGTAVETPVVEEGI
ncbi:MAG: hypothetical protein F6K11_36505 [Leptolyngbya sp. SIO3F4]|nr:hypothetical protein [Leptolyngbya sp. SIO3F4]